MASSGTYNYSLSNGEAVLAAFDRIQLRYPAIQQHHMLTARREINLLFSEWSNRQVNLWKVPNTPNQLSLVQGTNNYTLPANVVMILDAYRSINTGTTQQTNIYMTPISRTEFASYATPQTQGPPVVFWFERQIIPTVTMYPTPDGGNPYVFQYYPVIQIQDANLPAGETPDLPYRWYDALVAGLAKRLGDCYPPANVADPTNWWAKLKSEYDMAWGFASTQDTENVPLSIAPTIGAYYRR
jgi:hypothetical protein